MECYVLFLLPPPIRSVWRKYCLTKFMKLSFLMDFFRIPNLKKWYSEWFVRCLQSWRPHQWSTFYWILYVCVILCHLQALFSFFMGFAPQKLPNMGILKFPRNSSDDFNKDYVVYCIKINGTTRMSLKVPVQK